MNQRDGHRRKRWNEVYSGRDAWATLIICAMGGFLLMFFTNIRSQSLVFSLLLGAVGAALLGVPVLILIGIDRLRGRRDAASCVEVDSPSDDAG